MSQNNHLSLKNIAMYSLAAISLGGVTFFLWKLFKNKQLYERVHLFDKIQLANEKANQSLLTLKIDKQVMLKRQNLTMTINLMGNLNKKINKSKDAPKNPFIPPIEPGLFICELQPHHRLIFNKYNVYRNHLLIITKEYEPQQNRLNLDDFQQIALVYKTLGGLFFFNCGKQAGSSQKHKHIQILPSEARQLPIFVEIQKKSQQKSSWSINQHVSVKRFQHFRFQHGYINIPNKTDFKELALLFKHAEKILFNDLINDQSINYNLIGCDNFLLMIPRKKQNTLLEISVNSIGFLGSLLIKNQQTFNKILQNQKITPEKILEEICFGISEKISPKND